MGSYRSDDEALIGLARQLTDAYGEARTREDQDYACESIAEFLSEFRESAPSEALLALLDLPLTAETLSTRGRGAGGAGGARVRPWWSCCSRPCSGRSYDPDGPAPERAAETLDQMPPGEASLGLIEVTLRPRRRRRQGRGGRRARRPRRPRRAGSRGRARRSRGRRMGGGGARADPLRVRAPRRRRRRSRGRRTSTSRTTPKDRRGRRRGSRRTSLRAQDGGGADDDAGVIVDDVRGAAPLGDEPGEAPRPASEPVTGPDGGAVDAAYEEFLRRFEQDGGGDAVVLTSLNAF